MRVSVSTRQHRTNIDKMNSSYLVAIFICILSVISTVSAQTRKKEGLSLGEKYQHFVGLSQRKPIIRITDSLFKDYVRSSPKNYSIIILFNAMAPQRQCLICRYASEEFQIVANSFRYSQALTNKLFFGVVDFDEGTNVFNYMKLNTAPALIHFPAKGKPKPADNMDIQRLGFSAEAIAKWIADRTDVQIRVFRPPNYSGAVAFFMIFTVVCGFLYVRRNTLDFSKFYNKNLWASFAMIFTLAMVSGQMWNHIRSPPFVHKTPNGIAYIHGSSQGQLVFETYIILVLEGLMAIGMIMMTEAAQKKGDVVKRRTLASIALFLFFIFFSLILTLFRSKAHGYPYSLLFK